MEGKENVSEEKRALPSTKKKGPGIPLLRQGNGAFSLINEAVLPSGFPPAEALTVRSDGQGDGLTDQGQDDARRDNSASSGMITSTKTELQIPQ